MKRIWMRRRAARTDAVIGGRDRRAGRFPAHECYARRNAHPALAEERMDCVDVLDVS